MKKSLIRKYAHLVAVCGANVQKKQPVIINAAVDQAEFVTMVADECYKAGASYVRVDWSCLPLTKLHYRHQSVKTLSTVLPWEEEKLRQQTVDFPARIHIVSDDPAGLRGVNQHKMQKAAIARYPIIKPYRDAIENRTQWTIVAVPSRAWAKSVFPQLSPAQAVEKLWGAILDAVHVTEDNDPVAAWRAHNESFRRRCQWLNDQRFDRLVYHSANGTDFSADLIHEGQWCGGSEDTLDGVTFNPNMPTEEIFTSPMKGKAEGKLVATKPLSYQGQLIDKFWIRFEDGKAVEWDAQTGKELLDRMLSMDEGSRMLGELALIPNNSPISNSGILFYETLFDENASCHVALGRGFNDCIRGYQQKTDAECQALGINDSMIHVDFMIGAPDMEITGYRDGVAVPVFRNGEWAD